MKKRILYALVSLISIVFYTNAQTTVIPDLYFEDYLETHAEDGTTVNIGDANSMGDGIAGNGLVFTNRIANVNSLNIVDLGIDDLTGIEDFTDLEILVCSNNTLSNIDVSSNLNLKLLNASNNRIVGELDVSNNTNLESLFCASNQITILDVSANTLLKNVDVSDNALTNLDLSTINSVLCPEPQTNPVTACQGFSSINVSRNQLSSLIVANGFNDLITIFDASDNPDLFCIQIDNAFTPNGWIKDDWTYFTDTNCVDIYTYVPDDNFEQALINVGYDDVLDNLVLTANIETIIDLNVSNAAISSLVGIEDFLALEVLDCSNNTIESIDISNNLMLQEINTSNNSLSILDLSANISLATVNCSGNLISELNLNSNTALNTLNCSDNSLVDLQISSNVLLTNLDCSANQIEDLDFTANTGIINLLCNNNNLFALNINNGNNNLITNFNATNNPNLFCIKVDDIAFANAAAGWQKDVIATYNLDCGTYVPDDNFELALIDLGIDSDGTLNNFVPTADVSIITVLDVSSLNIEDLTGIEDFIALTDLNCSNNSLLNLDLNNNTALQVLDCSINQIENLDFTTNTALTSLLCGNNALRTLNVENGNNGALTVFNTIGNPNLFCINIDDATVGNIPVNWQKDDFTIYDGDCLNNRVTLIPDAFFEQKLIDFGYDDIIDGQVLTANIEHLQTLDVSNEGISDLTGIRDFKSLVELDCSGNFLDELDLGNMIYLERLNCSSNYLLTNNVNDAQGVFNTTGTISLVELYCAGNNLNNLDASQNVNLEVLDCADNDLDNLNVNGNLVLRDLNCSNNNLTTLDISSNQVLERLNCDSNELNNLVTSNLNNTTLTDLSCSNNNLTNLLVNNYQGVLRLNCSSNQLAQLNVTNNVVLEFLSVTNNQITEINLDSNINLIEALLSQNSLTELTTSSNTLLEFLDCDFNDIANLNLTSNTVLKSLKCTGNELTGLNLVANANLIEVDASSNMLTNLNLGADLSMLKILRVNNNQLEGDLDLTTMAISACTYQANQTEFCPENLSINLSNNLLSFINIQNGINQNILNFNASANPNLDCIQVDDANNVPVNWIKDAATSYNEDCNFGETYVPDDNFEQALIDLGLDSGPLNDYVPTVNIEGLVSLDISGNAISDLTGIEDFIALENFNCASNTISELDLSSNTNLLTIDCSNNQISGLDVLSNPLLTQLNCSNNAISDLDLSANTNLIDVNIASNNFTEFLPSEILTLQLFNCDDNAIVELNFQQNQDVINLSCQFNALEVLNIKNEQNTILLNLNAQNNPDLVCIETDTGTIPAGATWTIDATAQLAIECFFGQTYVPDDNFEQALIDLGFDSGPLDDYVTTENIVNINFLNISSREISDLTGIQDFINLVNLNVEDNFINNVDFGNNILLSVLDVSDNLLDAVDVSVLPNLTNLDVSNNSLTELSLSANLELNDLDISNNLIVDLDVSMLSNLEDFNCAFNQLEALDFTQNTNLNIVFCQSNLLVGDQLNLQNGNNDNLQIFNATNNPSLGCILVDDPVAVINNVDGTYDNWSKDASASYQIICEDADNDGVPNEDDLCPGTEFGATVDLFGCAVINLPIDNFSVMVTGETCLNSNNGKIRIETQQLYNYTVSLFSEDIIETTGEDFYQEYNFTNDIDILNLLAGTYQMCITIQEWPDYESCYTIVITEPNPLEVFASRMAQNNKIEVGLSGGNIYNVDFNGEGFTTHNTSLELQLQPGENLLKITTDLECQGTYIKRLFYGNKYLVYPNPFQSELAVYNGIEEGEVSFNVYNVLGQLVLSKIIVNKGSEMKLDTSHLDSGIYLVKVTSELGSSSYKLIKK